MNIDQEVTRCVPGMTQADSDEITALAVETDRSVEVVIKDVTAYDSVNRERYIVGRAYQYFKENPKATRRDYILAIAREKALPLFSVGDLVSYMPFPDSTSIEHAYQQAALIQALSVLERDGDQTNQVYIKRLRLGVQRDMWVVVPIDPDTNLPNYGPLFTQARIFLPQLRDRIKLIAAQVNCGIEELLFHAMIDESRLDKLDMTFFDFIEECASLPRPYSLADMAAMYTLDHLAKMKRWFKASTAMGYIIGRGIASPIRFVSHEGVGQYLRRIFAIQTKRGFDYYPKSLVRKREGNAWVWNVK